MLKYVHLSAGFVASQTVQVAASLCLQPVLSHQPMDMCERVDFVLLILADALLVADDLFNGASSVCVYLLTVLPHFLCG